MVSRLIDIGIAAIKKYPPEGFDSNHIEQFETTYLQYKNGILVPNIEFKNRKSLTSVENDVLTYFQEATGEAVRFFWNELKKENLPFVRKNKMEKILKRQMIKNRVEYDFVVDVLVPYQQEGLLDEQQIVKLKSMISDFDKRS